MPSLATAIQNTLREELEPGIRESLWKEDPVYPRTVLSSQRVRRNEQGRGYKVIKVYGIGLAGGAKFEDPDTETTVSGPNNMHVFGAPSSYPGIDEVTAPAQFTANVTLVQHKGNFYMPIEYLRFDQYDASIGSVVAQLISGVGRLVARQEAVSFWTDGTYKALGDIGDSSATVANVSGNTSAITVDLGGTNASGRVHRFLHGMLVDLYKSDGTTKRNADFQIAIDDVDPLTNKIKLVRLDGGELQTTTNLNGGITYAGAGGDDDIIVIKDSVSHGLVNINSWIKNSGTLFGVDLALRAMWKSYLPSSEGAALSESLLNKRYFQFTESFPGIWPDTAFTTNGVLLGLIDNLDGFVSGTNSQDGRFRWDRNGDPMDVNLGIEGFRYRFLGRPVTIHTSVHIDKGTWYGTQIAGGNLVRYVPPPLPQSKRNSDIGNELEFIAPLGGSDSIFMHATVAGRATDYVQAPFKRQFQIMPEDPRSLKMTGITEISV